MARTPQRTLSQNFIVILGDAISGEEGPTGAPLTLRGGDSTTDDVAGADVLIIGGASSGVGTGAGGSILLTAADGAASGLGGSIVLTPGVSGTGEDGRVRLQGSGTLDLLARGSATGTPAAGRGYVWVRSDSPTSLIFTDDAGNDHKLTVIEEGTTEHSTLRWDGSTWVENTDVLAHDNPDLGSLILTQPNGGIWIGDGTGWPYLIFAKEPVDGRAILAEFHEGSPSASNIRFQIRAGRQEHNNSIQFIRWDGTGTGVDSPLRVQWDDGQIVISNDVELTGLGADGDGSLSMAGDLTIDSNTANAFLGDGEAGGVSRIHLRRGSGGAGEVRFISGTSSGSGAFRWRHDGAFLYLDRHDGTSFGERLRFETTGTFLTGTFTAGGVTYTDTDGNADDLLTTDGSGTTTFQSLSDLGIEAGLGAGTLDDSTLRWDGTSWVGNANARFSASGDLVAGAADLSSSLQVGGNTLLDGTLDLTATSGNGLIVRKVDGNNREWLVLRSSGGHVRWIGQHDSSQNFRVLRYNASSVLQDVAFLIHAGTGVVEVRNDLSLTGTGAVGDGSLTMSGTLTANGLTYPAEASGSDGDLLTKSGGSIVFESLADKGLPEAGTAGNTTLRWDSGTNRWVENTNVIASSAGTVIIGGSFTADGSGTFGSMLVMLTAASTPWARLSIGGNTRWEHRMSGGADPAWQLNRHDSGGTFIENVLMANGANGDITLAQNLIWSNAGKNVGSSGTRFGTAFGTTADFSGDSHIFGADSNAVSLTLATDTDSAAGIRRTIDDVLRWRFEFRGVAAGNDVRLLRYSDTGVFQSAPVRISNTGNVTLEHNLTANGLTYPADGDGSNGDILTKTAAGTIGFESLADKGLPSPGSTTDATLRWSGTQWVENEDVKTTDAGALDVAGAGTFGTRTLVGNGSAAAPSVSFTGGTGTGMFYNVEAANQIGFATGGVNRWWVHHGGHLFPGSPDAYSIGNDTHRVLNIHLSGNISTSGNRAGTAFVTAVDASGNGTFGGTLKAGGTGVIHVGDHTGIAQVHFRGADTSGTLMADVRTTGGATSDRKWVLQIAGTSRHWQLNRYDATGTFIDRPFQAFWDTGNVQMDGSLTVAGSLTANSLAYPSDADGAVGEILTKTAAGTIGFESLADKGLPSPGSTTDATLRWSGTQWVENTAVRTDTAGRIGLTGQAPESGTMIKGVGERVLYASSAADLTSKLLRLGCFPYNTAQDYLAALVVQAGETNNNVRIGGGTGEAQSATEVRFYAAAAVNTLTGTEHWKIDGTDGGKLSSPSNADFETGGSITAGETLTASGDGPHLFGAGSSSPSMRLRKDGTGISEFQFIVGTTVSDNDKSITHMTDETLRIRARTGGAWLDALIVENNGDIDVQRSLTANGLTYPADGDGSVDEILTKTAAGTIGFQSLSDLGVEADIDAGTLTSATLRWNGTKWVENTNIRTGTNNDVFLGNNGRVRQFDTSMELLVYQNDEQFISFRRDGGSVWIAPTTTLSGDVAIGASNRRFATAWITTVNASGGSHTYGSTGAGTAHINVKGTTNSYALEVRSGDTSASGRRWIQRALSEGGGQHFDFERYNSSGDLVDRPLRLRWDTGNTEIENTLTANGLTYPADADGSVDEILTKTAAGVIGFQSLSDLGVGADIDEGTTTGSTLRWNGTKWEENTNVTTTSSGEGTFAGRLAAGGASVVKGSNGLASRGTWLLQSGTEADLTGKDNRFGGLAYDNSQAPVTLAHLIGAETTNLLRLGGGTGTGQAVTQLDIYTASSVNTLTGTIQWRVTGGSGTLHPLAGQNIGGSATNHRPDTIFGKVADFSGNGTFGGSSGVAANHPAGAIRLGDGTGAPASVYMGAAASNINWLDARRGTAVGTRVWLGQIVATSNTWSILRYNPSTGTFIDGVLTANHATGDLEVRNNLSLTGTGADGDGSLTMAGTLTANGLTYPSDASGGVDEILTKTAAGTIGFQNIGDLAGDYVQGPASATNNAIARYDGTTGKLIQNSSVTVTNDGLVRAASGTDEHPTYSFGSDNQTGIYNKGGGEIGFATLGRLRWWIESTGDLIPDNPHNIGTSGKRAGTVFAQNLDASSSARINNSTGTADTNANDLVVGNTTGHNGMTIFAGTTSASILYFGDSDSALVGQFMYRHSNDEFEWYADGLRRAKMGATYFGPDTNGGINSGRTSQRWGTVYTQNLDASSGALIAGLTYPTSDGSSGQFLQTDGSGNLSFASVSGTIADGTTQHEMLRWNGSVWTGTGSNLRVIADGSIQSDAKITIGAGLNNHESFGVVHSTDGYQAAFRRSSNTAGQHTGIAFAVTTNTSNSRKGGVLFERTFSNGRGDIHLCTNSVDDTGSIGLSNSRLKVQAFGRTSTRGHTGFQDAWAHLDTRAGVETVDMGGIWTNLATLETLSTDKHTCHMDLFLSAVDPNSNSAIGYYMFAFAHRQASGTIDLDTAVSGKRVITSATTWTDNINFRITVNISLNQLRLEVQNLSSTQNQTVRWACYWRVQRHGVETS